MKDHEVTLIPYKFNVHFGEIKFTYNYYDDFKNVQTALRMNSLGKNARKSMEEVAGRVFGT